MLGIAIEFARVSGQRVRKDSIIRQKDRTFDEVRQFAILPRPGIPF
jgi:hypothetical protein